MAARQSSISKVPEEHSGNKSPYEKREPYPIRFDYSVLPSMSVFERLIINHQLVIFTSPKESSESASQFWKY